MNEINTFASLLFDYLLKNVSNDEDRFVANGISGVLARAFMDKAMEVLLAFEMRAWSPRDISKLSATNPRWVKHHEKLFRIYDALLQAGYDADFSKAIFKQHAVLESSDEIRLLTRLAQMQVILHEKSDILRVILTYPAVVFTPENEFEAWHKDQIKLHRDPMHFIRWLGRRKYGRPVAQPLPEQSESKLGINKPKFEIPFGSEPQGRRQQSGYSATRILEIDHTPVETEITATEKLVAQQEPEVPAESRNETKELPAVLDEVPVESPVAIAPLPIRPPSLPPPPLPPPSAPPPRAPKMKKKILPADSSLPIRLILQEFDPRFTEQRWNKYYETKRWFGITLDPDSETILTLFRLVRFSHEKSASYQDRLFLASILLGRDLTKVKDTKIKQTILAPALPSGKKLRRLLKLPAKTLALRFHMVTQYVMCSPLQQPQCLTHQWENVRSDRPLPLHVFIHDLPPPGIKDLNEFCEQIIEVKNRVNSLRLRGVREWWQPKIVALLAMPSAIEFKTAIGPNPKHQTEVPRVSKEDAKWLLNRVTRPKD